MITDICFTDMMKVLRETQKSEAKKESVTLLGIGPVSELAIRGGFRACQQADFPAVFIASRNQVDSNELGGGYIFGGTDQKAFVDLLKKIGAEEGYEGLLYICRDHGGPWQRDKELQDKLPIDEAVKLGRRSFVADLEAGFNYLHIDPTRCPLPFSLDDLVRWTVEDIDYLEKEREKRGLPRISYEVGTEDAQGGITTPETQEQYLRDLTSELKKRNLPMPACSVGQTGTLSRMDSNAGHFDPEGARKLAAIAARHDMGFKEHNADHLADEFCAMHPELGISGSNVAPEFGYVGTSACLELAEMEKTAGGDLSDYASIIEEETINSGKWRKWLTDDLKAIPEDQLLSDPEMRGRLTRVAGHYVYDNPRVQSAYQKMTENLKKSKPEFDPHDFAVDKMRDAIFRYVGHFNLKGVNSQILSAIK